MKVKKKPLINVQFGTESLFRPHNCELCMIHLSFGRSSLKEGGVCVLLVVSCHPHMAQFMVHSKYSKHLMTAMGLMNKKHHLSITLGSED